MDRALIQQVDRLGIREGAQRAREMAERGLDFDGVFCVTDSLTVGVLRGLIDAGIPVPDRVKVIGFDNVSRSEFFIPRSPPWTRATRAWPSVRSTS